MADANPTTHNGTYAPVPPTARLRRLARLPSHQIAPEELDIRGWLVFADDGYRVGRISDVIVDTETWCVRHLEVILDRARMSFGMVGRIIIIPIACARVSANRRHVNLFGVASGDLLHAPDFGDAPLEPDADDALHRFFLRSTGARCATEGLGCLPDASAQERFWGVRRPGRARDPYIRSAE